jgi:hypothetical protein
MPKPGHDYYSKIPGRIGEGTLTPEQLKELEELGLLADRDDQGVLLQVFTKPLGMHPSPSPLLDSLTIIMTMKTILTQPSLFPFGSCTQHCSVL